MCIYIYTHMCIVVYVLWFVGHLQVDPQRWRHRGGRGGHGFQFLAHQLALDHVQDVWVFLVQICEICADGKTIKKKKHTW